MAEGLTSAVGGNGVLGDIEPGWSEQEFATPVNPNERAGGTGVLSYTAKDVAAGMLAINKAATSEYAPLGQVSGVVRTASKTGQRVSISHDNKLARYNAVRTMPPMLAASVPGALDLAAQVALGESGFVDTSTGPLNDGGAYWSLRGHAYGVNVDSDPIIATQEIINYQIYNPTTTTFSNESIAVKVDSLSASSFAILGGSLYAEGITGDSFILRVPSIYVSSPGDSGHTKLRIMGKTMLNGADMVFTLTGQPSGPSDGDYFQEMVATVDYSAETLTVQFSGRLAGSIFTNSNTVSIASLDLDEELAFRIFYTKRVPGFYIGPYSGYNMALGVCNTSDYSTVINCELAAQEVDRDPAYFDPWQISGNVRAIWYRSDLGDLDISTEMPWPVAERQDWESPRNYAVNGTPAIGEPSIGYTGSVWDWLQDACSAYFWEIGLDGDVVTARPVGNRELDTANFGASPTVTPTTTRTGRSVDVIWHNAEPIANAEVYDARSDGNRILSVGAAQETVTRIQTNAYLTSVIQPTRTTSFVPGQGTYYVIDSTGLPIVADQWEDYGGALSVAIDNAEAGTIEVTLTGPREQIPSTTAPYSLAVSDGQNQYAALSILGSGVVADPQTLNLLTGADPDITPQEVAFTVNNAFISTLEQAYDAGIWAAVDASGPRVAYTIDVPTLNLTGFGDTAGALIQAEDSTYRVTDATVGRTSTSINAVRHATVGAFDDAWSGENVGSHDTYWDTFLCEDQRILPYAGTPEATLPPAPIFPP